MARAFASGTSWERSVWIPNFLNALADEAEGIHARVTGIERQWHYARSRSGARRRNSQAGAAIDLIAAFPLLSATRLAGLLGVSVKSAYLLLERFLAEGLITEVTHRRARRLFALKGFEPLRETIQPPRRSLPGRGRGRPPRDDQTGPGDPKVKEDFLPRGAPHETFDINYDELAKAIAETDTAIARLQQFHMPAREIIDSQ